MADRPEIGTLTWLLEGLEMVRDLHVLGNRWSHGAGVPQALGGLSWLPLTPFESRAGLNATGDAIGYRESFNRKR